LHVQLGLNAQRQRNMSAISLALENEDKFDRNYG
jgi:hypothetical protein